MEENEQTLAKTIETLNRKLDEIMNKQKEIQEELQKNNKVLMQRINKLQEFNEIDDMRCKVSSKQLNVILKRVIEIEQKLY